MNNLQIRFCGPAGTGVNTAGEVLSLLVSKLGYSVLSNLEYESRIKGGVNNFDIFIGENIPKITKNIDVLICFNLEALNKNIANLKDNGIIFLSQKTYSSQTNDLGKFRLFVIENKQKYENIELLGSFCYYVGIDLELLISIISLKFKSGVEENIFSLKNIYSQEKKDLNICFLKIGEEKQIFNGNELVAKGLLDAGLEYYSAYPMTPASTIFEYVLKHNKTNAVVFQAEDEIAVVNSSLGASFTGAKESAYGSSGGGFALTSEALSFAVQAEIPITAILSQRAGPSTGTPTYFEQGDLNYALNPTFGDFKHIVLYPSTMEEAYFFAGLSLNLADIYQNVVILLIDKQISDMIATVGNLESPEINRGAFVEDATSYKRYEINDSGISPRVEFGSIGGEFIATSYEHDEYGATSEDVENKKAMTEKRFKKLNKFFEEQNFSTYELINKNAKKLIITFGFTSYNAKKFIEENTNFGLLIIKSISPLNKEIFEIIENMEEVIFVESNYSGQFQNYITKELNLEIIPNIKISNLRKYDLHPFFYEDFNNLNK